jgi:hypothetical protein
VKRRPVLPVLADTTGGSQSRRYIRSAKETPAAVSKYARVKPAGKRDVDVVRAVEYQGGSGVSQVIRRLEQPAEAAPPCGPNFNH